MLFLVVKKRHISIHSIEIIKSVTVRMRSSICRYWYGIFNNLLYFELKTIEYHYGIYYRLLCICRSSLCQNLPSISFSYFNFPLNYVFYFHIFSHDLFWPYICPLDYFLSFNLQLYLFVPPVGMFLKFAMCNCSINFDCLIQIQANHNRRFLRSLFSYSLIKENQLCFICSIPNRISQCTKLYRQTKNKDCIGTQSKNIPIKRKNSKDCWWVRGGD